MQSTQLKRLVSDAIKSYESRYHPSHNYDRDLIRFKPPRPGGCDLYCEQIFPDLYREKVPCVIVATQFHVYLMAWTSDKGALIIDPTIRQIYHDYPQPFFIGTADELRGVIAQNGGPERPILSDWHKTKPRVKDYYYNPEIIEASAMDCRKSWNGQGEFTPQLCSSKGEGESHAQRLRAERVPNQFCR